MAKKSKIKILYTINGEGLGHSMRSLPIILELRKKYDIDVLVTSKRAHEFMSKFISGTHYIEGPGFIYSNNKVDIYNTIKKNYAELMQLYLNIGKSESFNKMDELFKKSSPDIIITDFELLTLASSEKYNVPIICVCNNHAITNFKYKVHLKHKDAYFKNVWPAISVSGNINHHMLMSFFKLPIKYSNTKIYSPILRKEIRELKPKIMDYYLVYQTSDTNKQLISMLKNTDAKFIVYGFGKDETDGNITYRQFNNDQIFPDLKNCRACITNGGFTFVTEALSLHKPILCNPIKGQFEQILNGMQIERCGFGIMRENITRKDISEFINGYNKYYKKLRNYKVESQNILISDLSKIIEKYGKKNTTRKIRIQKSRIKKLFDIVENIIR